MRPALAMALLLLAGCASAPSQAPPPRSPPGAPEVRAVRTFESPMVDGVGNDAAWAEVPETAVPLGMPGGTTLRLRAMVHRGTVFLLLRWADPTETRHVDPGVTVGPAHVWQENSVGDSLTLMLPLDGPFPDDLDAPGEWTMDYWRWDAALSDRSGHALDAVLRRSPVSTERFPWYPTLLLNGGLVLDGGGKGESAANVLARGLWSKGEWTIELARALITGHADDRDLGELAEIPIRVFTSDRGGANAHNPMSLGASPVLRLLLPPEPEEDRQGPLPEPLGTPGPGR